VLEDFCGRKGARNYAVCVLLSFFCFFLHRFGLADGISPVFESEVDKSAFVSNATKKPD